MLLDLDELFVLWNEPLLIVRYRVFLQLTASGLVVSCLSVLRPFTHL